MDYLQMIQQWDEGILFWIRDMLTCKFLDLTMPGVSAFGNLGIGFILLAFFLMFHSKETRRFGYYMLLALALNAFFCNVLLKPAFARIRPYDALGVSIIVPPLSDFSFPSGHTSAAFACVGILWAMNRRVGQVALCFGLLLAFARLYLFVHYPTDVLCGAGIGLLASADVLLFVKWRKRKKK